ncbi:MAG: toll/interleukin-1 receptor domain-containing protein [Akkermansiaceae bacterium]|nr:toll/interleukin-1 receptor domain-containing protein [Akkermansiaceae bacterium]
MKLFISHASEDKADFVEPLVEALGSAGFEVWYDKYELTLGDSLLQKISQGLRECDYGVVVLSPDFFLKKWTKAELDGLFAIESNERKVILPIWKDVTVEDVTAFSPILAGRLGAPTSGGVDTVVAEIQRAVQAAERMATFSSVDNAISLFKALDDEVGGTKRAVALAASEEGLRVAEESAANLVNSLRGSFEKLASVSKHLGIRIDKEEQHVVGFTGPYSLRFVLGFYKTFTNSIQGSALRLMIYRNTDPWGQDQKKRETFVQEDFVPVFHHTGKLLWKSEKSSRQFTSEQLDVRMVEDAVGAMKKLHERQAKRNS